MANNIEQGISPNGVVPEGFYHRLRTGFQSGFHTIKERFLGKARQSVTFEEPDPSLPTMEIPPSLVLKELSKRTWRAEVVHEAVRKSVTWRSICKDELPRWLIKEPRSTDILYDARVMYLRTATVEALVRRQIVAHNGTFTEADIRLLRANVENDLAVPGKLETAVESLGLSRVPEEQDRHLITKKWSEATLRFFLAGWAVVGGVCTLAPLTQNPNQRLSPEQAIEQFRQDHLQAQIKRSQLEAQKSLAQPSLSRWEFNGLGRDGLPASLLGAAQAETMKHFGLNPVDDGDLAIFWKIWDTNATVKQAIFETVRDAKSINPAVLDPNNTDRLNPSPATVDIAFNNQFINSLKQAELVLYFTDPDENGNPPSAKGAIEATIATLYFGIQNFDPHSADHLQKFKTARDTDPFYDRMFEAMYDEFLARNNMLVNGDEVPIRQEVILPIRPLLEALHKGKQQQSAWAKENPHLVFTILFSPKAENGLGVMRRTPAQDKIRQCAEKRGELLREFLQREYALEGKTMQQIAKETGVSRSTVGRLLKKYGIESRGKKRAV